MQALLYRNRDNLQNQSKGVRIVDPNSRFENSIKAEDFRIPNPLVKNSYDDRHTTPSGQFSRRTSYYPTSSNPRQTSFNIYKSPYDQPTQRSSTTSRSPTKLYLNNQPLPYFPDEVQENRDRYDTTSKSYNYAPTTYSAAPPTTFADLESYDPLKDIYDFLENDDYKSIEQSFLQNPNPSGFRTVNAPVQEPTYDDDYPLYEYYVIHEVIDETPTANQNTPHFSSSQNTFTDPSGQVLVPLDVNNDKTFVQYPNANHFHDQSMDEQLLSEILSSLTPSTVQSDHNLVNIDQTLPVQEEGYNSQDSAPPIIHLHVDDNNKNNIPVFYQDSQNIPSELTGQTTTNQPHIKVTAQNVDRDTLSSILTSIQDHLDGNDEQDGPTTPLNPDKVEQIIPEVQPEDLSHLSNVLVTAGQDATIQNIESPTVIEDAVKTELEASDFTDFFGLPEGLLEDEFPHPDYKPVKVVNENTPFIFGIPKYVIDSELPSTVSPTYQDTPNHIANDNNKLYPQLDILTDLLDNNHAYNGQEDKRTAILQAISILQGKRQQATKQQATKQRPSSVYGIPTSIIEQAEIRTIPEGDGYNLFESESSDMKNEKNSNNEPSNGFASFPSMIASLFGLSDPTTESSTSGSTAFTSRAYSSPSTFPTLQSLLSGTTAKQLADDLFSQTTVQTPEVTEESRSQITETPSIEEDSTGDFEIVLSTPSLDHFSAEEFGDRNDEDYTTTLVPVETITMEDYSNEMTGSSESTTLFDKTIPDYITESAIVTENINQDDLESTTYSSSELPTSTLNIIDFETTDDSSEEFTTPTANTLNRNYFEVIPTEIYAESTTSTLLPLLDTLTTTKTMLITEPLAVTNIYSETNVPTDIIEKTPESVSEKQTADKNEEALTTKLHTPAELLTESKLHDLVNPRPRPSFSKPLRRPTVSVNLSNKFSETVRPPSLLASLNILRRNSGSGFRHTDETLALTRSMCSAAASGEVPDTPSMQFIIQKCVMLKISGLL